MKLVAIWIAVLGLAASVAASCSVNHRSGDFACQTQSDCSSNRACVDGFCVLGSPAPPDGGTTPDAPPVLVDAPPPIDAAVCPPQCTSCDLGPQDCTIDCDANPAACTQPITCPPGWNCDVQCTTRGSCRAAIDCAGESCTVTCSVFGSCRDVTCTTGDCNIRCFGDSSCASVNGGPGTSAVTCNGADSCSNVACGAGECTVGCNGDNACNTVACGNSCACDVACSPFSSCSSLTCKPDCDDTFGGGCTAEGDGCNTCP